MIPFAPWSALQLLMLLGVPLFGLGLTLYLLGVAWRLQGWWRWQPGGTVPPKRQFAKRFFTPARCAVLGVAALCLVWTGWVAYTMARFQSDAELAATTAPAAAISCCRKTFSMASCASRAAA